MEDENKPHKTTDLFVRFADGRHVCIEELYSGWLINGEQRPTNAMTMLWRRFRAGSETHFIEAYKSIYEVHLMYDDGELQTIDALVKDGGKLSYDPLDGSKPFIRRPLRDEYVRIITTWIP